MQHSAWKFILHRGRWVRIPREGRNLGNWLDNPATDRLPNPSVSGIFLARSHLSYRGFHIHVNIFSRQLPKDPVTAVALKLPSRAGTSARHLIRAALVALAFIS
jgi:hypothetical protein